MYGDSEVMRRRAEQLREQGEDIRLLADQVVAHTESFSWSGRAAASLRVRVAERAAQLRTAAVQHDTAAAALDKHVLETDRLTDAVRQIERRAHRIIEARPDDPTVAAFVPPPTGHRDWLAVDLPGL
ncbi:hypothetical protein [Nocardioides sp. R-C-SC26]|uniref:hypothetical protein n=1 Tax=Nocardioides sp. R-C-SC26 TaxID=2870414 RepID=UPI001E4AF13E|nr:hypothetical protein [Nocardioides sp. R-C-SC26]